MTSKNKAQLCDVNLHSTSFMKVRHSDQMVSGWSIAKVAVLAQDISLTQLRLSLPMGINGYQRIAWRS